MHSETMPEHDSSVRLPAGLARELRQYHPGIHTMAREGFPIPLSLTEMEAVIALVNEVFNDSRFSEHAKQDAIIFLFLALRPSVVGKLCRASKGG